MNLPGAVSTYCIKSHHIVSAELSALDFFGEMAMFLGLSSFSKDRVFRLADLVLATAINCTCGSRTISGVM
jgi:hypothetical protein